MRNPIVAFIIGLVAGVVVTGFVLFKKAPDMMLDEMQSRYDFPTTVDKLGESAVLRGWKVVSVNDLQKSMKDFGKDVRQVKVFSLCNPEHAYGVLSGDDERIVSSLMPCRVAVYEKSDGEVYFSMLNAGLMSRAMGGTVSKVMRMAMEENREILSPLLLQP